MTIRVVALLTGLGLLSFAQAATFTWQSPKTNSMENLAPLLEKMREDLDLPALAAAVVRDDQMLGAGAVGVRKFGEDREVTLHDKFHIGSITKSMTALLAVLFEKEGKITFDTTAQSILHDWEFPESTDKITLRMLLQNRSGLPTKAPRDLWSKAWDATGDPRHQREEYLRGVLQKPLEADPDTQYIYSNQGFALAGAMLERIAGKPWEQLARERIFAPLGLQSAGFHAPDAEGKLCQPWGHRRNDDGIYSIPPRDNPPAIAPAGAVHASILDMARYAAFHMQAAAGKVPELKSYVDELYISPEGQTYAFGWATGERGWAGGEILNHNGSNTMNFMVIWIAPKKQYAFVVATNIGDESAREKTDKVVGALIKKYID